MNITTVKTTPFLKWVGGKRQLLPYISPLIPQYTTYYEPFLGGGAVLFNELPKKAVINDLNEDLINCYRVIKNTPDELVKLLKIHKINNSADYFYRIRELDRMKELYSSLTPVERAARIIYLNKTCFNGLYRVNSSGYFNAPYGKYVNPNIVNENVILDVSQYLNWADIKIFSGDYRNVLKNIPPGSFIYLDPPYMPIGETSFTSYTADKFDKEDQIALKKECDCLNKKDIKFLLSNSSCEFIEDLYEQYIITRIPAKRSINSCGNKRGSVEELLIRNY